MNYWFEVFHSERRYKYDTYHEAVSNAKQLTKSGCYAGIKDADVAYIIQHSQLDNCDERISITKITAVTEKRWYEDTLM